MSRRYRRFTKEFKLKIVLAKLAGRSVVELTREHDVLPGVIYKWLQEYITHPETAFGTAGEREPERSERTVAELEQMIGRLTMENDFLKKALARAESASKNPTSSRLPQSPDGGKS